MVWKTVPQTAGAEAALRSEAQTSDRRLRSQIGGWDLRSEAEPWEGGGAPGGPKRAKREKRLGKPNPNRHFHYVPPAPYVAAATGTVLGTKSEENAKSSTFCAFLRFRPPGDVIFLEQVHYKCAWAGEVAKS